MSITYATKEENEKENIKANIYSVQRAKRGDKWLILALIVPISFILASLSFESTSSGTSTAEYFIINFLFFSIDVNNLALFFPFSLQLEIPFIVPSLGHPIYSTIALIQFLCVLSAVVIRLYQYNKQKKGEIIESGVVGALACLIVFFEIIKFLISGAQLIDLHLIEKNITWSSGLVEQFTINNSLLNEIPIIPETLLGVGLPVSVIFKLLPLIPFGLVFAILWAYQEYKAFPPAFIRWLTRVVRYGIIGIFVIISVFPLIWIFFVTINDNITLRAGKPIWPLNINAPIDSKAWEAFFNIRTFPGHTEVEGFTYLALTLFFVFLFFVFYKLRKHVSLFYENITGNSFRSSVKILSIVSYVIFLIIFSGLTLHFLLDIMDQFFNIPVLIFFIVNSLALTSMIFKSKSWNNLFKRSIPIPSIIPYVILFVLLSSLTLISLLDLLGQLFDPWVLIFFVVTSLVLASLLFKFRNWYSSFEGYYLEDGIGFSLSLISGLLAVLSFYLMNSSIKWVYYQWETQKEFNVGNWFFITVLLGAGVSIIVIIVASISAYSLSRFRFHGRGLFGGMILSTQIFPGVILVLPLFIMMARLGLTGQLFGLGFAYSAIALPFVTYLLKGFFDAIPPDLEEQAMIDGTTRIGAFRKVVLPLALPGIVSTFIFSFLAIYTEYLMALVIYNPSNQDNYTIALAMLRVFQADITQRGVYYNEMAVFAILVALPIIAAFIYLQKYLLTGLTSGGTKG
jgi:ABC-type glycerol-3-phosphate transport system permease component